jgi:hypothetical protein
MKNIKFLSLLALLSVGALFLTNCSGTDEDVPEPSPVVNFIGGTDYVDEDISLAANSTFTMGIIASHESNIKSIKITRAISGNVAIELLDSSVNDKVITDFFYTTATQNSAGSEVYSFIVADKDGNSTTKTITVTNIGVPGLDLNFYNEDDNGGDPIVIYNFRAPNGFLGAYELGLGPLSSSDPNSGKDIQDSTNSGESWPARWSSRNGSVYKKVSSSDWTNVTNDATIQAAWDDAGAATNFVNLSEGDIYLMDIKNNGKLAIIRILTLDRSVISKEFVSFEYKLQE